MTGRTMLASSIWPRSGGDRRNSSLITAAGPRRGNIASSIALGERSLGGEPRGSAGAVVASDGSLRVVFDHRLLAVSVDDQVLWHVDLPTERVTSRPVALDDGRCLVGLDDAFVVYDREGILLERFHGPSEFSLDDSGLSPNLTHDGSLISTSAIGVCGARCGEQWCEIEGLLGYDIVPPAVFDDDTLAFAAYAGTGYCRVHASGEQVWVAGFEDADLLPTISRDQRSAVGSLNDRCSRIFDSGGACLGTFSEPSTFAEYPDGGWIALFDGGLARLSASCEVCWRLEAPVSRHWGVQPIVDRDGAVFSPAEGGLLALDSEGEELFYLRCTGGLVDNIAAVAPRALGFVLDGRLWIVA